MDCDEFVRKRAAAVDLFQVVTSGMRRT